MSTATEDKSDASKTKTKTKGDASKTKTKGGDDKPTYKEILASHVGTSARKVEGI